MIRKILIANRGEIACRIIRTARRLGISTVAVYSDADADALHVTMADEAVRIGPPAPSDSYLQGDAIIRAALETGADAIHPGYGFLSENPQFVEAVAKASLTFIGPSADSIRAMGLKDKAKALMEDAGVSVVPGYHGENQDSAFLAQRAEAIGFPVLIKARAGGGGKGMRRVDCLEDFAAALQSARREGENSFGDPTCLVEKYIQNPRHIEIQVLGDSHGNVVHLFERDCSLQRRHQKVIEEAPAPGMTAEMRNAMGQAAIRAAKAVNYCGAGTVEFIVDGSAALAPDMFWFMEMNTRLQVEHPITEAITKVDLVALQISIAEGAPLPFGQEDLRIHGHAFEARLYAEDAAAGFLPATGTLRHLVFPEKQQGIRIDTGVRQGDIITPFYDPMIAKIIVHGEDRPSALRKLEAALGDTLISGSVTNRAFLGRLATDPDFAAGRVDTGLIERKQQNLTAAAEIEAEDYAVAAVLALQPRAVASDMSAFQNFRLFGPARQTVTFAGEPPVNVTVETSDDGAKCIETPLGPVTLSGLRLDGDHVRYKVAGHVRDMRGLRIHNGIFIQRRSAAHEFYLHQTGGAEEAGGGDVIAAPMPGMVRFVSANTGEKVKKGQSLLILEAMKMEHTLAAPRDGVVLEVTASVGDQVEQGAVLLLLETEN
ncbi:acetyl/propionyl/methylcrotonyl-CoA carboxylase subunit alpha [Neorhizobium sp. LjRoot104]|uniref:acetyl/propionyl/methylcrotonyl-CoA carboxylase subunit alpha n=1 Tax=Neorhizobium sp. LjRoot104 TaxID=3342254 RepID=UPI003ED0FA37